MGQIKCPGRAIGYIRVLGCLLSGRGKLREAEDVSWCAGVIIHGEILAVICRPNSGPRTLSSNTQGMELLRSCSHLSQIESIQVMAISVVVSILSVYWLMNLNANPLALMAAPWAGWCLRAFESNGTRRSDELFLECPGSL